MEYEYILTRVENRIATLTLNRPQVSNAFCNQLCMEAVEALNSFSERRDVGAVVLTGAGKHFSAGGDIHRMKELIESGEYLTTDSAKWPSAFMTAIRQCKKPVIAMINGAASGAGFACALACDFRVVDPNSRMTMAFVNMGLGGDTGSIFNLVRLVGQEKAEMMMMLGEPCVGEECCRLGLAGTFAEEGKLAEMTYALAEKLAGKSNYAQQWQKRLINSYFYDKLPAFCADEGMEIADCSRQPDFTEAVNAFLEKRPPVYNQ